MRVRRHQRAVAVSITVGGDMVVIERPFQCLCEVHRKLRAVTGAVHIARQRFAFAHTANKLNADLRLGRAVCPRQETVGVHHLGVVVVILIPQLAVQFFIIQLDGAPATDTPHAVGRAVGVGIGRGVEEPVVAPWFVTGDFGGVQEVIAVAIVRVDTTEQNGCDAPVIVADERNINALIAGSDAEVLIMPACIGFAHASLVRAQIGNQVVVVV
ncbi:hypothetical protein D3C79_344800 [compost metagenome]